MLYDIAIWLIPLILAIVFHEVSHGWIANLLGDPTAKELGRLTPNPIKHADLVGTVILPLILAITKAPIFGWAKPVPVNKTRLRHPRRDMVLVALAGPGINLSLALATAVALGALAGAVADPPKFVIDMGVSFILVNVFLAIFNLIPFPPFDGGHVVEGLLPRSLAPRWEALGRYALPIMIALLLVLPMLSPRLDVVKHLVAPPANALALWFLGLADAIA